MIDLFNGETMNFIIHENLRKMAPAADKIARIIRNAYEEELKTINGDACFEHIAAKRIIDLISQDSL